jgi:nucleoside-diphosphate-sugar epimerase
VTMKLAVFGLGFIGRALADLAQLRGMTVLGFSRRGGAGRGEAFDAARDADLKRLREGLLGPVDCAVVTFPPQQAAADFWPILAHSASRRILLSSTGVYQRAFDCTQPVLTEDTPLVDSHARVPAERAFLESGGIAVRLAGLFGGERNPIQWLRDGRVGYEKRQANLVHRDDVAQALLQLATHERPNTTYNVADGQRHTWREIVDFLVARGELDSLPPRDARRNDASVSPDRLLRDLPDFRFRDFWAALEALAEPREQS